MIKDIIDFVRPPDTADGRAIRRWRSNVAMILIAGFLYCAWSLTGWGFARASDINEHVQKTIEPLKTEITEIKQAQVKQGEQLRRTEQILTRLSAQLTDQLITSNGSQIRLLIGKRCKEPDAAERERMNREIEKLQLAYKEQTGDRLQIRCDEL
jgi:septal ring factor EnvC (AmiA/AmiB activator)